MASIGDALAAQRDRNILQAPATPSPSAQAPIHQANTSATLQVALVNNTDSSNVWAYVSGLDLTQNNAVYLMQSDGKSVYHPSSPGTNGAKLVADCHIRLGGPGSTTTITIPQTAGGRFWFCRDNQLSFLLNQGPALVEPSVTNPSDPNYNLNWGFAEFTLNADQLFANISYVDFVALPIALRLQGASGQVQEVKGMGADGLDSVCQQLAAQSDRDGAGWRNLVVKDNAGRNLRALSPNSGIVMNSKLFSGYYQPYVDAVWAKYSNAPLHLDTQVQWGVVDGQVSNGLLRFGDAGSISQPSEVDIFSCNTGPFGQNQGEMGNICARVAAAFNRSTLLDNDRQPTGEVVSHYYQNAITNHYARIVHSVNDGGRGYAFAYDDVSPSDAQNVAGTVADPNPTLLTITIGGTNAQSAASAVQGNEKSVSKSVRKDGSAQPKGLFKLLGGPRRALRSFGRLFGRGRKGAVTPQS